MKGQSKANQRQIKGVKEGIKGAKSRGQVRLVVDARVFGEGEVG